MWKKGLYAALSSALFLGLAPVFGKSAIVQGVPALGVVAIRTCMAAFLMFLTLLVFRRGFLFIYPAGLLGCLLAGGINGVGSLLYYSALSRIDASLGQLLYSMYPLFVVLWCCLDHQRPSKLTLLRLALILPALYLLAQAQSQKVDLLGMLMMLAASALYALHLPINQRVLYDMPPPTVTFYTLVAMTVVVVPVYFAADIEVSPAINAAWGSMVALTFVTYLSRMTLFMGVKHLGGMQTSLLGIGELLVTMVFSYLLLGESLSTMQWLGALLLMASLGLVLLEKSAPEKRAQGGWLSWIGPAKLQKDLPWPYDG
jgi:drug/metabolite transporter (DMT)-like permease